MRSSKGKGSTALLLGSASMLVLGAMAFAAPVSAQETTVDGGEEVVVVGVRRSLQSAQQIKKNADTVVDSITANDIGSFPDKSVAEALQRVAGITVNRFAASDDTFHFSAEPSGVVVRGLQQVRSEFNGRDIFTADSNRGLSWSDVSPELMGGVDVYKNQTAELIEGGIAGTVNLKTRLPFDSRGRVLALSADYTYGDVSKDGKVGLSGIYSDRWETEIGEFGFMANFATSEVVSTSEGVHFGRYAAVVSPNYGVDGPADYGNPNKVFVPSVASIADAVYTRARNGLALAGQWQNNDRTMTLSVQYNQSKKRQVMEERILNTSTDIGLHAQPIDFVYSSADSLCHPDYPCTFDGNNGLLTGAPQLGIDVWLPDLGGSKTCYSWNGDGCNTSNVRGTRYSSETRYSDGTNDTRDLGVNFKWRPTDRLALNFDVQKVEATQTNYDISATMKTFATVNYDLTGDVPQLTVLPGEHFNFKEGNFANPANWAPGHIMDHVTDSDGEMFAARIDAAYTFDSPWLNTLKFGVRVADREQNVRWSTYNWKVTIRDWEPYTADNYFVTGSAFPQNGYEVVSMRDDFMGGGITNEPTAVFYKMDMIKDQAIFADTFGNHRYKPRNSNAPTPLMIEDPNQPGSGVMVPNPDYNVTQHETIEDPNQPGSGIMVPNPAFNPDWNMTNEWAPVCMRADEVYGCFREAEMSHVQEKTKAAYIQLKFGGDDAYIFGNVSVTGNIGVRYVETENISTGGVNYSEVADSSYATTPYTDEETFPGSGVYERVWNYTYFIGQEDRQFTRLSSDKATARAIHKNWLPSFNVRLGLTDEWFLRFAASRAMSRPDIGNLKAYSSVGRVGIPTGMSLDDACGEWFVCSGGVPTAAIVKYSGSAQNPYLKPVTADQVDFTVEYYFSNTGSLTFNLFHKQFNDYIQFGSYYREFTNNGVTREVLMNGPMNGDGAAIRGFEIAYQGFFDFLPSPWDGFGIQANYTRIQNDGIVGSAVKKETAGDDGSSDPGIGGVTRSANAINGLPLEQLSEDAYNFVLMYEKGSWSARAAYNWRSEYMVTAQDCCAVFPVWQEAAGYLDARLAYRFSDNVEVSVEGTNLLNTQTNLMQQVDGPMANFPNNQVRMVNHSWRLGERRFAAALRLKY